MAEEAAGPGGSEPDIRVVICDDHSLLREGTRQILERAGGFEVVAEAADGNEAVAAVERLRPDVVILDVRLPGPNGVEVARRIAAAAPDTRVLMLSAFDEIDYVRAALAAGVAGYLLKTTPGSELVGAVRAACGGMTVLDPSLSTHLMRQGGDDRTSDGFDALTSRERDVVALVAEGLPNKAIADRLGISPRTVEGHLNHIFDKLGVTSRLALVRLVMKSGHVEV